VNSGNILYIQDNPEPELHWCNDYPELEYTQAGGSARYLSVSKGENIPMNYSKLKVLVLDDDILTRRIINKALKLLEIRDIFEATDGLTGLEVSYNYIPNLIICDINMTPMSGGIFITRFKNQLWKICQPKIIVVTGSTDEELIKNLNVDLVIRKPFKIEYFISNVALLLS